MSNFVPIGPPHDVGGIIHVQIQRDTTTSNPNNAFQAVINAPGFSDTLTIGNGVSKDYTLPVSMNPTLHVEIDNFTLLPGGARASR